MNDSLKDFDHSLVKPGDVLSDDAAMMLAIQVAQLGAAHVSPNPVVGCTILDGDGRFLASGYHAKYGEAHAEINALEKLSEAQLEQAQVFVTLEPCAHEGKTGPCARRLARYKLKKVVYGIVDPFPLVAGKGADILMGSGITTVEYNGALKQLLQELPEIFLKNVREQKIFVAMKVASSLDGQIALKNGESRWITGDASRAFVHELRARHDAIIVGRRTIECDDPSLNVRHPNIQKDLQLIILDPDGHLVEKVQREKLKYKFLDAHAARDIIFAHKRPVQSPYRSLVFLDLADLLAQLWNHRIRSLFIEGGAKTYASFMNANLVDRVHLFINPSIIGAENGLSWTDGFGINSLQQKVKIRHSLTRRFGDDVYLTGRLA